MSFTQLLLDEISDKRESLSILIDQLRKCDKIYIFGTGLAGKMIYETLSNLAISVKAFADNNKSRQSETFCGRNVVAAENIEQDAVVIIAANVRYGIHEQLKNNHIYSFYYIDPVYLYSFNLNEINKIKDLIAKNADKIDQVYGFLEDKMSKKVFKNVLIHRCIHNLNLIWDIYDEHQYFGNDLIKEVEGTFVDCGAFQGDTLLAFLAQIQDRQYKYIAFEADKKNYIILNKICEDKQLSDVCTFNLGVWDKRDILYFKENATSGDVAGKIVSENDSDVIEIQVDSIDSILGNRKVDFIKMDIEGSEIKALNGAKNNIQKNKPTLAISAYHETEHLWEVPLLIKEIYPDYHIFFRHHMWNMADTVCYARR